MLLENTEVPVERTLAQLQAVLTKGGAAAILIENDPQTRQPRAVKFQVQIGPRRVAYELPARTDAVYQELRKKRVRGTWDAKTKEADRQKAERIAWRQILRWVEAQLALVQLQMVELAEVFLPYAITLSGRTLYQEVQEHGLGGLLPAPELDRG